MSGIKKLGLYGCATLFAMVASIARADAPPYQQIIDRNVFALKPPTPPPKPEDNRPPPPNIKMTGIITLLGQKRVLLKLQPPAKPGVKNEEESFILASGERQGEVEVLEIDEKNGIVKVNDYGTVTNLTWENNGVKVAAAAPPVAPGGAPNQNPFNPGGMNMQQPHGNTRVVPTSNRPMRPGYNPAAGSPGYQGTPGYPGTASSGTSMPALGNAASPIGVSKNWPPEETNPETQTIMDAAYKMKNAQAIARGDFPDVPGENPLVPSQNNATPQPQQQPQQQYPNPNFRPPPRTY